MSTYDKKKESFSFDSASMIPLLVGDILTVWIGFFYFTMKQYFLKSNGMIFGLVWRLGVQKWKELILFSLKKSSKIL